MALFRCGGGSPESLKAGEYIKASRSSVSGTIETLVAGTGISVLATSGCFAVNLKGLSGNLTFACTENYEGHAIALKSDGTVDYPSIFRSTSIAGQTLTLSIDNIDMFFFSPASGSGNITVTYVNS